MLTVIFGVNGMSCSHCERAVDSAVGSLPGVLQSEADAKGCTVKVTFDEAVVSAEAIIEAIEEEGYTVADDKDGE